VNLKDKMTDEIKDTSVKEEKIEEKKEPLETKEEAKIKSKEDELNKSYKELEKKYKERESEVKQGREFAEVVQPILQIIRDDPELFSKIDTKLKGETKEEVKPGEDNKQVNEVRNVAFDLVLAKFEEKHGINKLPKEEADEIRNNVGKIVEKLTRQKVDKVDLRHLGDILDDAYLLANKEKLIDNAKLEALLVAQGNQEGSFPSVPSSTGKTEESLTPEETKVATKMGLTREQYLEGKKKSGR
jgi:hypothetical protein